MRVTVMKSEIGLFPHFVKSHGVGKYNNKFIEMSKTSANMKQGVPTPLHLTLVPSQEKCVYSVHLACIVFVYNKDPYHPCKCCCLCPAA